MKSSVNQLLFVVTLIAMYVGISGIVGGTIATWFVN